ncbi:IS110 family transposase [Micromonospora sp. URMC 107]|uniref:IS110 family transposase n=1 Tax=Micromonospora sp. URMC 107 TaxID=3423418 RepID=UPI003F1C14C1
MSEDQDVTVGVDTHKDVHVAAVLDQTGRVLGTRSFPTTMRGYAQLATWLSPSARLPRSVWKAAAVK